MRNVAVRRERVLEIIRDEPDPLTSKQMARIIGVKEVSVRAAITWLILGGYIIKDGHVVGYSKPNSSGRQTKYKITLYKWTGKTLPICAIILKELPDEHGRDVEQWESKMVDGGKYLQDLMRRCVA